MIWIKGIILGVSMFAIGVFVFLVMFLRRSGPLLAGPGQAWSIDPRTIAHLTTQNLWFWIAGVACVAIGMAIVASWPGKFSSAFWILLGVVDLAPATALGIFLMLVQKLQAVGR
jgi:hypothetical protein